MSSKNPNISKHKPNSEVDIQSAFEAIHGYHNSAAHQNRENNSQVIGEEHNAASVKSQATRYGTPEVATELTCFRPPDSGANFLSAVPLTLRIEA